MVRSEEGAVPREGRAAEKAAEEKVVGEGVIDGRGCRRMEWDSLRHQEEEEEEEARVHPGDEKGGYQLQEEMEN